MKGVGTGNSIDAIRIFQKKTNIGRKLRKQMAKMLHIGARQINNGFQQISLFIGTERAHRDRLWTTMREMAEIAPPTHKTLNDRLPRFIVEASFPRMEPDTMDSKELV